jgi:hypothetical protein
VNEEQKPTWAIVELMGHVRLAGRLTEEEKFGGKLGRLDIPQGDGFITQYFGSASVYRISLVTEDVARHVCKQTSPAPVSPWDFPARLPAPRVESDGPGSVEDDEQDDDEQPELPY